MISLSCSFGLKLQWIQNYPSRFAGALSCLATRGETTHLKIWLKSRLDLTVDLLMPLKILFSDYSAFDISKKRLRYALMEIVKEILKSANSKSESIT